MALLRWMTCAVALLVLSMPVRAEDDAAAKETPEEAFNSFKAAVKKKDGDAVWGFFSKGSKKKITEQMGPMLEMMKGNEEAMAEMAKEMGKTVEEIEGMKDEEIAKLMVIKGMEKDSNDVEDVKWLGAKVDGKTAICETQEKDKDKEQVAMVLEDGRWKLDLEATEKLKGGDDEGDDDDDDDEGDDDDDEEEGSEK